MPVAIGILTSHPSLLPCQLERLAGQLPLRPEHERISTVGVGTVSDGTLLLRRLAPPDAPQSLADEALASPAEALVYRAELLPASASVEESGQPLRYQRWLFAQSGSLEAWPQVQAWVESELPQHLRPQVDARTLGAAAFALFLKGLRPLEAVDAEVEAEAAARLLAAVSRGLAERAASEGAAHAARLLLLATDGRVLVATRRGGAPLWFRLLEGSSDCARCQLTASSRGQEALVRAHQQARAVVVATAPVPSAHWLALGDGQALAVGPSLCPEVLST
jgi:hypothetical protein